MAALDHNSRSFYDALSLARNGIDEATIFYSKGNQRAVYEVTVDPSSNQGRRYGSLLIGGDVTGILFVNGKGITTKDVPSELLAKNGMQPDSRVVGVKTATAAKTILEYNGIDTESGWGLQP